MPTMMVSSQRVSCEPRAAIKKLARADMTRPSGRIAMAKNRMASETNSGPRQDSVGVRAFAGDAHDHHGRAQSEQQRGTYSRRGACAKGKSVHALQIARCPKGEGGDHHQHNAANEILRAADPFWHRNPARPLARCISHSSLPHLRTWFPKVRGANCAHDHWKQKGVGKCYSVSTPLPFENSAITGRESAAPAWCSRTLFRPVSGLWAAAALRR